jgi:hypothetical protein
MALDDAKSHEPVKIFNQNLFRRAWKRFSQLAQSQRSIS